MQIVGGILKKHPLVKLVQVENFAGWVYGISYDRALVMTNDLWKDKARGIPHNCFLIASSFNPDEFAKTPPADQQVLLLRVVGSAKLPQDDDLVRTKVDFFQQQTGMFGGEAGRDYDAITLSQMQFGGLECRILGTFYVIEKEGELRLGSDLESFAMAARLNVYRPRGEALRTIVNHIDPLRKKAAIDEAKVLGLSKPVSPFRIGTVRYTSTDRLHRSTTDEQVPVFVQPSDFLARRTAVLGMTRTGKSNMVKQMVSVVKRVADEGGVKIGQIIYDINGEYANANQQDKGALADIFPKDTVRYRMLETPGFEVLQNNFYVQLTEGYSLICRLLEENGTEKSASQDVKTFLNGSLDEPEKEDASAHKRWQVKVAAYKALLHQAEYPVPKGHKVFFEANSAVRAAVEAIETGLPDPSGGLTLDEAVLWFRAVREANRQQTLISTKSKKPWLDDDTKAMLNMLVNKSETDAYIRGYRVLLDARPYHSPRRQSEVGTEIYKHLQAGKIVILDLSVGNPTLRERISKQIAQEIFSRSMQIFIAGDVPPSVVVYIEEAHNLIGKKMDLTETWPRLAKEGAKYRIALVYATQEVSSVHSNILANTENWFITHLNNDTEIKELSKFYDFEDFSLSLMRAQDVGFARIKTLSSPFVIPVQIDKFDPEKAKSPAQSA